MERPDAEGTVGTATGLTRSAGSAEGCREFAWADKAEAASPEPAEASTGADELHRLLAAGLARAVRVIDGRGGAIYLPSGDRTLLSLATLAGLPRSLLRSWWRIPVGGELPASEAFRSSRSVHVSSLEETTRRYPQMSAGLPYPIAAVYVPIRAEGRTLGVLCVLRTASQGADLKATERRRLRGATNRLGAELARLAAQGHSIEYDDDPVAVRLMTDTEAPVRVGMFDWNLDTGALCAEPELCLDLGIDPVTFEVTFEKTFARLATRVYPQDLPELEACVRDARTQGKVAGRRFRVCQGVGRPHPVELWGVVPDRADPGEERHLVGAIVDCERSAIAAQAVERLPEGVFSLDQEGSFTYTNRKLQELLQADGEELLGRSPWEAVPWLSDPGYEDRYRAAVLSQEPTSFLARQPSGQWLAFLLYPDAQGLTCSVLAARPPDGEHEGEASVRPAAVPEPPLRSPPGAPPAAITRAGALYQVVQMASALTGAVTVREVCRVVADELLPALGGQQLAIFVVKDRRLYLAWQIGYDAGYLEQFDGAPLGSSLPVVRALTSGAPLFFESRQQLTAAYPNLGDRRMTSWACLPLIASSRPVGSCSIAFAKPRSFSCDERTALTALGGLVGQALERARLYDAEFTLARGLQDGLLPHRLPAVRGIDTAARYLPGTQGLEIGGDWYDVISTSRGVAVAIGDVEGHNVAAAATMGQLRSALKAFAASGLPPAEVARRTNQLLTDLDADLFASCCYLLLDPENGEVHAVRAGHPPPLLRRPDGATQVLDLPGGPLLGVDRTAGYPLTRLRLEPGSILALYTDGLVERPGRDIDDGIDWLRTTIAHSPVASLEEMADRLIQQARGALDRPDDIALLLTVFRGDPRGDPR
jgi:GAF domain-containing protein